MNKKDGGLMGNRKSRDLRWETADQLEKRITGSWNRKSRGLEGETTDQWKKSIVGSRGRKTAEKTRAQSPKSNLVKRGWSFENNTNKKKIFINLFFFYKNVFLSVP